MRREKVNKMSEIKVENPKKKNTFRQTREKAERF